MRLPIQKDTRVIPVATVSQRYALVQHHELINWLEKGISASSLNPADMDTELVMSEYGERLKLKVLLPDMSFDADDGYQVEQFIEVHNSVDRSCALEFMITRRRLVCLNGMWTSDGKDRLRKIHNIDWMNREDASEFIKDRLSHVSGFKTYIQELIGYNVSRESIEVWADDVLTKSWGVHAAARVCHIARSGYDGKVGRPRKNTPPHSYPVSSDIEVPGACAPVKNLYHLCQAMSWVAGQKNTIESSDTILEEIPRLIISLME